MLAQKFIGSFDNSMLEDMDEFKKRYEHTYMYVTMEGNRELCHIDKVAHHYARVTTKSGLTFDVTLKTEVTFDVLWPEKGLFNYKGCMAWVSRIPDRQWKRAVCDRNVQMLFPVQLQLYPNQGIDKNIPINITTLEEAFKPAVKTTIMSATKNLSKRWSSQALTRNWGLSLSSTSTIKGLFLWYNLRLCGIVDVKEKTISVTFPALWQEISDFNRDYEDNQWTLQTFQ